MNSRPGPHEQGRGSVLLLLGLVAAFLLYCFTYVPRLTNNHLGDVEFTGWSGILGSRIRAGETPYVDFILPIPPGSSIILALIEGIHGKALLLHELWLNALCHLIMGILAYLLAARLTTRFNALLTALCTLVTIVELNKELAYDHTALTLAWASVTVGAYATLENEARRRRWLWLAVGFLASLTFAFKQSTAIGIVGAWIAVFIYLVGIEVVARHPTEARRLLRDAGSFGGGVALGIGAVWLMLASLGTPMASYVQALFVDGPQVKGGSGLLVTHLVRYLTLSVAYPPTWFFLILVAFVGSRVLHHEGGFFLRPRGGVEKAIHPGQAALFVVALVGTFGGATALALIGSDGLDSKWVLWLDRLKTVPMLGYPLALAYGVAQGQPISRASCVSEWRTGHRLNALFIAAFLASLLHNTSAPELRTFYDNNPVIPLLLLVTLLALDQARLPAIKGLFVLSVLLTLFGSKLHRALEARTPAEANSYWAGLQVNPRGEVIEKVARHVQAVAQPDETVLVLPEDLQIAGRLGRPRPALRGAIIYVDQYPERLLAEDLEELRRHPPKVIIIHPKSRLLWQRVFRTWSATSATERLMDSVEQELIPRYYELGGSYETHFLWRADSLQIWVRKQ